MSGCDALIQSASAGVAASLRAVDCVSGEATATAFGRLFGTHGALLPALTALLTIYVASFAVLLLTGRATLSVTSLTPRMITLGLVLTFTTSWVAYQGVVWNLTVGAPDQIAGVLLGARGSATQMFADRIDILFNAIAETAQAAQGTGRPATASAFTPGNLMWVSALMLLLGTVGVLVTAKIALAILLAVGPVFITLALFNGTRGLFAGWLRAVLLMALTPLFAVLGGAVMVEFAVPLVAALRGAEGIDGRAAMALFVVAAVHCAIMSLAIRVASTTVAGWRVFGLAGTGATAPGGRPDAAVASLAAAAQGANSAARARVMVAGLPAPVAVGPAGAAAPAPARTPRAIHIPAVAGGGAVRPLQTRRARGIGSRFAGRATSRREAWK